MLGKDKSGKSSDADQDQKDTDRSEMENIVSGSALPMRMLHLDLTD